MIGSRWIAILLSAGLLLGAVPAGPPTADDYARREAESPGLEGFEGGFHGALFLLALATAAAVVCLWATDCWHGHHHHDVHPPAEGRRPAPIP